MRRLAGLMAALLWASAAFAQMSIDDEAYVTKTYPALAEAEWYVQQHPGGDATLASKVELAMAGLGKSVTSEENYRGRRLFFLRVLANPGLRKAMLIEEDELKQALDNVGPQPSPKGIAQLDELMDASVFKTTARSTGGSYLPPPPPLPAPNQGSPLVLWGGIAVALVVGVAGGVLLSRKTSAPAPMDATEIRAGSGRLVRPAKPGGAAVTGPQVIPKTLTAPPGPPGPPGPLAPVAARAEPTPVAARKILGAPPATPQKDISGTVDPMARTHDMAFDQTNVYQPGQAPAGAGIPRTSGKLSASGQSIPLPNKGGSLSNSGSRVPIVPVAPVAPVPPVPTVKTPAPATPSTATPPQVPPPPRQPVNDDRIDASKMNRTLPPYQPRGVSIRRQKKPPPLPNRTPINIPDGVLPDRYTVLSVLGKGGMGIVYKAFDNEGKREVALKTLGADVMATDTARERFVREYETLNALDHPNIIKVYDMGCITTPYFAMEYANGEDLGSIMLDDNVPIDAVLEIGIQLSNAMEYAHTEGVYHRDIKPSNLMITSEGLLKIVDFGLVKDTHASALTLDGTVLGSLRFMAPEQLSAEHIDARSDVYSVGMTLYYLLSGATPFDGNNPVVKLTQEPSSVLLHAPDADKRLAAAIDRSIRKDAKDRWQTARELEDALRAISL